jgi:hypothetical protein
MRVASVRNDVASDRYDALEEDFVSSSDPMRTLYANQEEMFSVEYDDATNGYFIDVVAGGAGLYTMRVRLSDEEIHEFQTEPARLTALADRVRKWPERFENRLQWL